jgi:hypothetical protein
MTFNIGSITSGITNIIGRDQHNYGGQQGTVVTTEAAQQAVRELRGGLAVTALNPERAAKARAQVDEIHTELRTPQPNKSKVARVLEQLTHLLKDAGALADASARLIGPIRTLTGWLGTL